jgi:hypothetical protein
MALDATVGGASSNSFGTRTEANTFFADRLYTSVWDAASDANKDKALITACSQICQLRFFGEKATATQALPWPRLCVRNEDAGAYSDLYYASDEIPVRLKQAQFIYAHELLKSDLISENQIQGLKRLSTGTLEIELEPSMVQSSGSMPSVAMRLLRGLVMTGGRVYRA